MAPDCKSGRESVRWFESSPAHQNRSHQRVAFSFSAAARRFHFTPKVFFANFISTIDKGLILGIVDTVQKNKKGEKKGVSIAGLVLSAIAIVIISVWTLVIGNAVSNIDQNELEYALRSSFEEANITFDFSDYEDYE